MQFVCKKVNSMEKIRKYFAVDQRNTDIVTECMAGVVAFASLSYVFLLVPAIFSFAGVSFSSAYFAVLVSFAVANIYSGITTNTPDLLRPSIVCGAYYVYIIILSSGASAYEGLGILLVSAALFAILSFTGWRGRIYRAVPGVLREGTAAGIGLLLVFLGLRLGNIIVPSPFGLAALGNIVNPIMYVSLLGLLITAVFVVNKLKYAVLLGMLITGIISYELDYIAVFPGLFKIPVGLEQTFWGLSFTNIDIHFIYCLAILLTALLESSAVVASENVCPEDLTEENIIVEITEQKEKDKHFSIVNSCKVDALGTVFSACLGMVPMVCAPEAKISDFCWGKTGLVPLMAGFLGIVMLFCEPVMREIAEMPAVFVPALIIVGSRLLLRLRIVAIRELQDQVPLCLMLAVMALTADIAAGIGSGTVMYVMIRLFSGQYREISRELYFLTAVFCAYFIYWVI